MTEELRSKLSKLRALAPRLNAETDQAAKVIHAAGAFLATLELGVSGEAFFGSEDSGGAVDFDDDDRRATSRQVNFYLAYARYAGTFDILVTERAEQTDDNPNDSRCEWRTVSEEHTPWSQCDRETKLKSFAVLPRLLDSIADKANRLAEASAKTSAEAASMIQSLAAEGSVAPNTKPLGVKAMAAAAKAKKAAEALTAGD